MSFLGQATTHNCPFNQYLKFHYFGMKNLKFFRKKIQGLNLTFSRYLRFFLLPNTRNVSFVKSLIFLQAWKFPVWNNYCSRITRKFVNMLLQELKDFCGETTIHGLNHVANDHASFLKRLLWFAIFIGSLCYAGQQLTLSLKGKDNISSTVKCVFWNELISRDLRASWDI